MRQLFSKDNRSDAIVGLVILVSLLLSSNLLSGFMPSSIAMLAIALFVAALCLFAVLIWRESPRDEREAYVLLYSDRLGFVVGAIILSIGLVGAALRHESTTFLALVLSAMVLAKLLGKYLHK
jgi:cobalamin synthase